MYTSATCPFCIRAEKLLHARGVDSIEKIRVDLDPVRRDEMMRITGRRSVPQIFIGDDHVGDCEDIFALDREGSLTLLLHGQPARVSRDPSTRFSSQPAR
ncbi:MAG: glutaredoxin 3 [Azoarcus sp.]|jgi:glutaredoxin 3|nr:glutaredoxin 3 [Azoarcus sp.]